MKRLGLMLLMAVFMGALMLLQAAPVQAHTCSSVCNQIRRACLSMAKATTKVAYAGCESDRDACRAACEVDPGSCCQAAYSACTAACAGDPVCEADCAAALADCGDCVTCCNDGRVSCRGAAVTARSEARVACDASRDSCPELCVVDPIDNGCVQRCKADERVCRNDAKGVERQCKRNCQGGTSQRACVRECRKKNNEALQLCSNQEILCLGVCAGIIQ
jgi:hypothetical protein